ncbi:MAG TPA: zinc-binding dehydrogenase [Frankiaceae bacterium]|jgi:NADPH2:quinone reductase|nr:zinc-binding dehydrogenase [Frankiaceae bacterium]
MQAVQVKAFGGPEVLQPVEVPAPSAKPGEVVIETAVASVLWVETMIRRTGGRPYFTVEPPYVPGNGVGGIVIAVGEGVDPGWIARAVVAHTSGTGGYAQMVAVPAEGVSVVPSGLDVADAAALLHDGVTATAIFDRLRVAEGDRVLVLGASGGLGIAAMQLARCRGAQVIAAARDARKLARLRRLGTIVDSDDADWQDRVRGAIGEADVIIDNLGGALGDAAFGLLAREGRFSAHGTASGRFANLDPTLVRERRAEVIGIGDVQLDTGTRRTLMDRILVDASAGRIRPLIGQTWPLARAAEAHAAIEARTVMGTTQLLA